MICQHAASGCNYPEAECAGLCHINNGANGTTAGDFSKIEARIVQAMLTTPRNTMLTLPRRTGRMTMTQALTIFTQRTKK